MARRQQKVNNRLCKPLPSKQRFIVEIGKFYEPSLLPDFSEDKLQLVHDKLMQYDVRDIDGELIPTWLIERELKPGTVVLVSAVLHIYNIKNDRGNGFCRVRMKASPSPSTAQHNLVLSN